MSELEKLKNDAKDMIVREGMKRALGGDDDDTPEQRSRLEKMKGWLILGGSVVGLVVFLSLFVGFLQWLFGVLIVAGLGYGAYLLVRPKLRALAARSQEKRAKLLAERTAKDEADRQVAAEKKRAQDLEDQMAALKARVKSDGT